jgi:hypothetical protein
MDGFIKERSDKAHPVAKNMKVTDYNIYKKNKEPMSADEVRKLARKILNKAKAKNPNAKMSIRAANITNEHHTLKGFDEGIDTILDEDDYFRERVKDTSKFNEYYRMVFHIVY